MDRPIIYTSEQGRSTDILFGMRGAMTGIAKAVEAILGTGTLVTGLACTPTIPASLTVNVGLGQIYSQQPLDATAYGALGADTADQIVKQGLNMVVQNLSCPAPITSGQSINYLIQATYQDQDLNNVVLPYYNSANPSQPLSGQNNTGAPQPTERHGVCVVAVKAGAAATTGTQTTPAPDSGYVGLSVVTVANGQSTITSGNISTYGSAPFIPYTLTQLAPLASPALTGSPTVPTQSQGDNSTKAASTAYADRASRSSIQSLTAAVASNALTVTLNPTYLDFRSSTLTSGAVNTRQVPSALSLTAPSGATLGSVSGISSRLVVLAIDNAGTVELALINLSGGANLDETTLISTSTITGAANSASTAYSNVARSNVPFRVVGFVDITEATAGTWATGPTTVQGEGGQAISALQSLGYGQSWQSVTRTSGTTYYNTTGRPIQLMVWCTSSVNTQSGTSIVVNGTTIQLAAAQALSSVASYSVGTIEIPPGASYTMTDTGTASRSTWILA